MSGKQCEKKLWLEKHAKYLASPFTEKQKYIMQQGSKIGKMAREQYPDGILIKASNLHPTDALVETKEALDRGEEVLFEPAFLYNDCLARVDILVKVDDDSWEIIEVKGSTKVKDEHIPDVSIQKYVLQNSGINVVKSSLMYINNQSISPDFNELFIKKELTNQVEQKQNNIEHELSKYKAVILDAECPDVYVGPHCNKPYSCPFNDHCWKDIKDTTIFNVPYLKGKKLDDLLEMGVTDIKDIPEGYPLTENQQWYVNIKTFNEPYISHSDIKRSLSNLKYPIHFLDFETHNSALPKYDGIYPYANIPFQFSCHTYHENGTLEHNEFLATENLDPRNQFITTLLDKVEGRGSIMVYNAPFERTILSKLRSQFPEYAKHIDEISIRIWDLLDIFKKYYRHPDFNGSNSIKVILPVLVPGKTYEKLDLNKGDEAGVLWEKMLNGSSINEKIKIKKALLEYCEMDTMAMFEIFQHLSKIINYREN